MHDQYERELAPEPAATRVAESACPCCGCYLVRHFRCGCGASECDYCANCGHICLQPAFDLEILPWVTTCQRGPVEHEHTEAEKARHMRMWRRRRQREAKPRA